MNCKQTEELLPLYAGRDLEEKRSTLVTEHLQTCVSCARVAHEYRESVQLTEQFAPPVFSDAVYAGIRQRVLREIGPKTTAPAWSQTIASLFRPRLTWAVAGLLLIVVSVFAIYFIVNRRHDEQQQLAHTNSGTQENKRTDLPSSENTGGEKQQLAGVPQPRRRKKSRATSTANNSSPQPGSLPEPRLFPHADSAALSKPLRVEIQTKDPKIRIIWFVQPETKLVVPGSKGT